MMRGNATSEEEVPSTSSSSSLKYLRSFQRLKPWNRAISPSTRKTKSALVRYTHKEEPIGQLQAQEQLAERQKGPQAELADGEGHGAECPDGRHFHDQRDDFEGQMGERVGRGDNGLPQLVRGQGHAEEYGDQQDLENFAVGEGAHQGIGNDVQDEIHRVQLFSGSGVLLHGLGIEGGGGGVDSGAGLDHFDHYEPDEERDGSHHLEVEQRFEADAAEFAHIADPRDSGHYGEEDDRRDHHADELDETVAEGLHHLTRGGNEGSERDAGDDAGDHAEVQAAIEVGG